MKKLLITVLTGILVLSNLTGLSVKADDSFSVPAKAALAVDAQSGKILYSQNATTPLGIASITKNMVAYIVLQQIHEKKLSWNDEVKISDYAYNLAQDYGTSNIGIKEQNAEFTVRDLFNAMMIQSADSAAVALAQKIGGSEPKFVDMMRNLVKSWGITDAKIVNASGLPNSMLQGNIYPGTSDDDENMMSATDVAIIAKHLINDYPEILDTTKQPSATFDKGGNDEQNLHTYNYMLKGYADFRTGVDGLKTGTTTLAGACFVGTTTQNGFRIITVVLNADNADSDEMARFDATNSLMNHVYGTYQAADIATKNEAFNNFNSLKVLDGQSKSVKLVASEDFSAVVPTSDENNKSLSVKFDKSKSTQLEAAIVKGQKLVKVTTTVNDKLGYLPGSSGHPFYLVAKNDVERSAPPIVWWNHFVRFVNKSL